LDERAAPQLEQGEPQGQPECQPGRQPQLELRTSGAQGLLEMIKELLKLLYLIDFSQPPSILPDWCRSDSSFK